MKKPRPNDTNNSKAVKAIVKRSFDAIAILRHGRIISKHLRLQARIDLLQAEIDLLDHYNGTRDEVYEARAEATRHRLNVQLIRAQLRQQWENNIQEAA